MSELLWVVVPYICLTTFVVGHVWRYRYDKFGWTTRSSQLYEDRLLRIGSPLFHFGIIGVFFGHVIGLGIPEYEAKRYEGRIREGGILVSVHCDSSEEIDRARNVLVRAGAQDVSSAGEAGVREPDRARETYPGR